MKELIKGTCRPSKIDMTFIDSHIVGLRTPDVNSFNSGVSYGYNILMGFISDSGMMPQLQKAIKSYWDQEG